MSNVILRAPYPGNKTTLLLPPPSWLNGLTPESDFQLKRTRQGRTITHPRTVTQQVLKLKFRLTRMASLGLEAFINSYQAAKWEVQLHDGSKWVAELVAQPIRRTVIGRQTLNNTDAGREAVDVNLELSATRLS